MSEAKKQKEVVNIKDQNELSNTSTSPLAWAFRTDEQATWHYHYYQKGKLPTCQKDSLQSFICINQLIWKFLTDSLFVLLLYIWSNHESLDFRLAKISVSIWLFILGCAICNWRYDIWLIIIIRHHILANFRSDNVICQCLAMVWDPHSYIGESWYHVYFKVLGCH